MRLLRAMAQDDPALMEDEQLDDDLLDPREAADDAGTPPPPAFSLGTMGGSNSDAESQRWLVSLERSIRAIVSIRLLSVRAFDGNGASFSVATGFIVDLKRGIVLTNRHVVTPGPVVADAIFLNKEEVDLVPIYR